MKMKRILLALLAVVVLGGYAAAQEHHTGTRETTESFTQGIGWIHTPFLTNWFVEAQVGPSIYFGYEDNLGLLKDRIKPNANLMFGRWMFPMLGYRFGGGFSYYEGFLSRATYDQYRPNIGYGQCEYEGATALGGYYWHYDSKPGTLVQRWKAAYITADAMFNISHFIRYKPSRRFFTYGYIGFDFLIGLSEGCVNPQGNLEVSWLVDPNMGADGHLGIIESWRATKNLEIYADVRATMYEGQFDREKVQGVERGLTLEDWGLNVNFGMHYNFNFWSPEKRLAWYKEHVDPEITDLDDLPNHMYTSHAVNVNVLTYVDTIYTYDTISEFSAEYDQLILQKAQQFSGVAVDSLRAAFDRDCHEYTLEDILEKQLIPYEMVFFELDKWDIRPSEDMKIARMAYIMKAFPNYKFLLIGSADSKTGTEQRNQFLSTNRSDVVYNKLIYQYDVNPDQLKRVYMGGILDFDPFELNRATVIIMDHEKVMEEFMKLKANRQAGGSSVEVDKDDLK